MVIDNEQKVVEAIQVIQQRLQDAKRDSNKEGIDTSSKYDDCVLRAVA